MVVILLLLTTFAWAKENFRVFPDTSAAAEACFLAGLCDAVNGCCSGHGYCNSTTTPTPTCVCAVPTGCHSSFTTPFSGNRCETGIIGNSLGSPDGCCISDTYDVKQEVNGACNPRSGNDPNTGLRGNLLRRSIYQNYTNPYTNNSVKDVADYLTDAARGAPEYTNFNMLALAILQVGQLDIVRYALSDTEFHNISGVLIPKLKHQNRTGEAWGNSTSLKKEFENLATGQIDLDFLYANGRVPETTYGTSGPYINYTSVLSQYSKIASKELLLLMEFFGHNHNFLVRTLEMANWNQTSFVTPFNHTALCKSYVATSLCSTYTTNQQFYDKLFEWARGANIRLLQIALGSALGLLAPNDQPTFDYYFHAPARNWQCFLNDGIFNSGSVADVAPDLSGGSIFADHITRNKPFTHLAASGIHYLYSMAEPVNYSSIVTSDPTCDVAVPTFAQKILLLSQTKIRKFGGRIDPSFYDGLTLQLLRERELGVESYNAWMAQTGDFVGRVDTDLYLGLHKDADSSNGEYSTSRLFQDAGVPRVLLALYTPINDALAIDDFGAWSIRDDGFTHDFLPAILSEQAYNQFSCAVGGYCVDNFNSNFQQQNAWTLLVGSRWGIEFAIPEQLFGPQSVMQTHVCTFPGYVGAMRTAGTIHAGFMAALLVDYPNGWTLPSYHSFNQQDQDLGGPMFRGLPNSISSCLPWRVVRKDEDLDTECCGIGICNCDSVFGASSPPCPEVNPCTSYDRIVSAHAYNDVFLNYLNSGFSDPVQPDGMS